jgi:hypothetical protein
MDQCSRTGRLKGDFKGSFDARRERVRSEGIGGDEDGHRDACKV